MDRANQLRLPPRIFRSQLTLNHLILNHLVLKCYHYQHAVRLIGLINSLQNGPNVTRSGKPILGSDGENPPTPSVEK